MWSVTAYLSSCGCFQIEMALLCTFRVPKGTKIDLWSGGQCRNILYYIDLMSYKCIMILMYFLYTKMFCEMYLLLATHLTYPHDGWFFLHSISWLAMDSFVSHAPLQLENMCAASAGNSYHVRSNEDSIGSRRHGIELSAFRERERECHWVEKREHQ